MIAGDRFGSLITPPIVSSLPAESANAHAARRGRRAADGHVAIPAVLARQAAERPETGEAGAVQGQEIVEDLETNDGIVDGVEWLGRVLEDCVRVGARNGTGDVLELERAGLARDRIEVDDRAALWAAALGFGGIGPGPQGERVADGQDAVVDDRLAAISVAARAAEDQLAGPFLGEIVPRTGVAHQTGDVEAGVRVAADADIGVERDRTGPRIVAGDVQECAVIGDAGAVQDQPFVDWIPEILELQLGVGVDRGRSGGRSTAMIAPRPRALGFEASRMPPPEAIVNAPV